ncbi:MAG: malonyl CoA-acyl carrier protein transacylase, partial [Thiohalocapsa sp.]
MTAATLAILFPGQGSQSVGMLADLADVHAEVHATFAEASE